MRRHLIFAIFILTVITNAFGQDYSLYSNDTILIKSKYLEKNITLNLHLPETHPFSADSTTYPITIIFDSQHERTYPRIISSFDLLTSETQIPESIIIGMPFNIETRRYLTSSQKNKNDKYSGIEKTELFLFSELIPRLQKEFKANDFITVIGHSRTAFLVNYLTFKQSNKIDIAIALSGFYNKPLLVSVFQEYISNNTNFPNKFRYYFTAGNTQEEEGYLKECKSVFNYISSNNTASNFKGLFYQNDNANHMTNYWVSIPTVLIDAYADYNAILNNWFYGKLEKEIGNPIHEFETDLVDAGKKLGFNFNPNLTHIFSLASSFGYGKKDFESAINFIMFGKRYYPDYLDFDLELIQYYKLLNKPEIAKQYESQYVLKVKSRKDISENEKMELLKNIQN
ncbi:MAG: alpha/beta hydrolase-fold protein [Bacteroidota bacterium]